MPVALTELGAERYAFLVVGLGWVGLLVAWILLQLGRVRVPAPLFWLAPVAMLSVGAGAALQAQSELAIRLASSPFTGEALDLTRLDGVRVALSPVLVALYGTVVGLTVSAPVVAIGNVLRGGPSGRWTPTHAAGALLGVVLATLGLLSGPDTFVVAMVSAVSLGVASLRSARGRDGRRMAAGRGLVASLGSGAIILLGLAHPLGGRLEQVRIWTRVPFLEQDAALAAAVLPANAVISDLALAAALILCGFIVMLPVARRVVDARASAGFVVGTLLFGTGVMVTFVPLRSLQEVVRPDPARTRIVRLEALGIEVPTASGSAPWQPGHYLTVDQYWVTADRERLLPFKEGTPDPEDDGQALESFLRRGTGLPLVLEVDRRVTPTRLLPVLQQAHDTGFGSVCLVVRPADDARLGCLDLDLGAARSLTNHLLIEPDRLVYITDGAVEEVDVGAVDRIEGPVAVHLDDDLEGDRLFDVLGRDLPDPLVVLSP